MHLFQFRYFFSCNVFFGLIYYKAFHRSHITVSWKFKICITKYKRDFCVTFYTSGHPQILQHCCTAYSCLYSQTTTQKTVCRYIYSYLWLQTIETICCREKSNGKKDVARLRKDKAPKPITWIPKSQGHAFKQLNYQKECLFPLLILRIFATIYHRDSGLNGSAREIRWLSSFRAISLKQLSPYHSWFTTGCTWNVPGKTWRGKWCGEMITYASYIAVKI